MASAEASAPTAETTSAVMPKVPTQEPQTTRSQQLTSPSIEMSSLSTTDQPEQQRISTGQPPIQSGTTSQPATMGAVTISSDGNRGQLTQDFLSSDPSREPLSSGLANKAVTPTESSRTPLTRMETVPAIGPATDKPTLITKEASEGPVLFITLLLASTGARHPYKLDGRYLRKRNVEVEGNNPINMSLYKLKELILRDWRNEWDAKPSSPESIRLIFMGKMLNDKSRLTDNGFTNGLTPQIVHMAIKPQEIVDEEEANKAIAKDREGNERSPGCRCLIQ